MAIEILDLPIKDCDFPYLVGGLEHELYDFPYIGNNPSIDELIFFKMVKTC